MRFESATDREVVQALELTMRAPKAWTYRRCLIHSRVCAGLQRAPLMTSDDSIIINQSGRGDKDIFTVADAFEVRLEGVYYTNGEEVQRCLSTT